MYFSNYLNLLLCNVENSNTSSNISAKRVKIIEPGESPSITDKVTSIIRSYLHTIIKKIHIIGYKNQLGIY